MTRRGGPARGPAPWYPPQTRRQHERRHQPSGCPVPGPLRRGLEPPRHRGGSTPPRSGERKSTPLNPPHTLKSYSRFFFEKKKKNNKTMLCNDECRRESI